MTFMNNKFRSKMLQKDVIVCSSSVLHVSYILMRVLDNFDMLTEVTFIKFLIVYLFVIFNQIDVAIALC